MMAQNKRNVAFLFLAAFVGVSLALLYWQVIRADELVARQDNPRLISEELRVQRGRIYDRRGLELVTNAVDSNGIVRRVYHQPDLAPVTGFVNPQLGPSGLELALDGDLAGRSIGNDLGRFFDQLFHRPRVGSDVLLTIDPDLQRTAEQAMEGFNGAVVALNPKTGEILALVSKPFYDPNQLTYDLEKRSWEQEAKRAREVWEGLRADPAGPLVNRATQGLYTPGSTFKLLTLAAVLEKGIAKPTTVFKLEKLPPNSQNLVALIQRDVLSCSNNPNASELTLVGAFAWSCNEVFAKLGLELGPQTYQDYARRFGLGEVPPIEIPAERSLLFRTRNYFGGDERVYALASTAMGQGELAVTPLQMALIAAAVANNGVIVKPHLVAEVRDPDGTVVRRVGTETWKPPISRATAQTAKELMIASVETGYARTAAVPGIKVGGKTGTAELGPGSKPHSWFVGFAPGDDPQLVVAVIKEFGGYGSTEAAPVAKTIFEAAFKKSRQ